MAYGARLESVLGASPRGFESPILRNWARIPCESGLFVVFQRGKNPAHLHGADRRGLKKGNENQAWRFRAVKVAAPAVATKVAAMSTSDPKPVLANSERFGE